MRLLISFLLCATTLSELSADQSWPQFRGPSGDGHAGSAKAPTEFDKASARWKTEIPGKAWSSPVVADGVIWMTTAVEQLPTEEERKQILEAQIENPRNRSSRNIAKSIELNLVGVEFETGSIAKVIPLATIENPDAIHTLNSYASPTPMIDGDQIHCHFGTYGTFCVNRGSGQIVWQRKFPLQHSVGPGSSPLVVGDVLVLIQDGVQRQYVSGLNKQTGETIWEVDRPELGPIDGESKKSFCTPIAVTDKRGRDQVVCVGAHWIIAYRPETGQEIWRCNHGQGFSIVPRPVCDGSVVYFSTGYGKPNLVAVRIDGEGDVTDTHLEWTAKNGIPAKPSPILLNGLIYVIDDTGVASCIESSGGDVIWKKRVGGNYSASPILAGGLIYFSSQEGKVTVIRPGRTFQLVAENQMEERIMASPAAIDQALVLRTENALYRID